MKRLMAGLLLTGALMIAAPAAAQFAAGGGPIDITANELELVDAQHLAIWRGDVEAMQGRNRMRADVLNIYFAGTPSSTGSAKGAGGVAPGRNWGKVQRVTAEGNVFYISPTQTARGDHGLYEQGSDSITITGDVIVVQGQSVVHGDKLVIDLKTNRATMVSDARGTGAHGRVRGIFYPNDTTPAGAPAPPPPRRP
jgi:lipopolysaccharide export system protein LptA